MPRDDAHLPDSLKVLFRRSLLEQSQANDGLGLFELSLFEFYMNENAATIDRMLSAERAYVDEQQRQGVELVNDSGIVAAEYFTKRIRYADVIYLCSLVETFLENACKKLEFILDSPDVRFRTDRGGAKWERCKDFLERYGGFAVSNLSEGVLRSARAARNCIAHDNGDTAGLSETERTFLSTEPGLKIDGYEVIVEQEFIRNAFAAFKYVVASINSELKNLIDRQLRESK
jgi:hypothetical protein